MRGTYEIDGGGAMKLMGGGYERGIQVSNVSNVPLRGLYRCLMCLMFH